MASSWDVHQGNPVTQSLMIKAWANAGQLTEVARGLRSLPLTSTGGWSAAAAAFARVGDIKR